MIDCIKESLKWSNVKVILNAYAKNLQWQSYQTPKLSVYGSNLSITAKSFQKNHSPERENQPHKVLRKRKKRWRRGIKEEENKEQECFAS